MLIQEVSIGWRGLGETKELNQGKVCKGYSVKGGLGCRVLDGRKRKGPRDGRFFGMSVLDYF